MYACNILPPAAVGGALGLALTAIFDEERGGEEKGGEGRREGQGACLDTAIFDEEGRGEGRRGEGRGEGRGGEGRGGEEGRARQGRGGEAEGEQEEEMASVCVCEPVFVCVSVFTASALRFYGDDSDSVSMSFTVCESEVAMSCGRRRRTGFGPEACIPDA